MMNIIRKEIRSVLPGEIILHPIYRKDGLILINHFKEVTGSILIHLRAHCDAHFPVLVLENKQEYEAFVANQVENSPEFIQQLKDIFLEHQNVVAVHLDFQSYSRYEVRSSEEQVNGLKYLIHNPVWENLDKTTVGSKSRRQANLVKEKILHILNEDLSIMELYEEIIQFHDVLVTHSLNTMAISLMIGLTLELSVQDLTQLAFATLFADIGYTKFPKDEFRYMLATNIRKEDHITQHVKASLEMIKSSPTCMERSIVIGILDHHEHYDGTGIPNGKKAQEISLFGRIIAIAQAYDELVGGYLQGPMIPVLVAQNHVWQNRGHNWDEGILSAYIYRRNYCKIEHTIFFEDGQKGKIIGFTDFIKHPLHPIVQLENGQIIDLLQTDLSVVRGIQI